jgi:hypothetical protein
VSDLHWVDSQVSKYSLALVDTLATHLDNGRVLGYDTAHGYAHRPLLGRRYADEFQVRQVFEADVRAYMENL